MIKTICTLSKKRASFSYDWSRDGAVLQQAGEPRIDSQFFLEALHHFSGKTVDGGFSQDAPPDGGFGEWVETESPRFNSRKLTPRHGSFMAAILCEEFGVQSANHGKKVVLTFPAIKRRAMHNQELPSWVSCR
jgi:hypothetical protein